LCPETCVEACEGEEACEEDCPETCEDEDDDEEVVVVICDLDSDDCMGLDGEFVQIFGFGEDESTDEPTNACEHCNKDCAEGEKDCHEAQNECYKGCHHH